MTKAWADVFGDLNTRESKPRQTGATMVLDKCQGSLEISDHLTMMGEYVDHWKLSFGTPALLEEKLLRDKIATLHEHDVLVYPGGTLTEIAMVRGVCRDFMRQAQRLGFAGIEISDGTIHLSQSVRRDAIRFARDLGLIVVAEVGKKDPAQQPSSEQLAEQALADFESGASWVTIEARESGRGVGIYGKDGAVHKGDVEIIAHLLGDHLDRIIWEAPLKSQQEFLILRFGANVCLGNVQPRDVLGLEALRVGLRFETFRQQIKVMEEDTFR